MLFFNTIFNFELLVIVIFGRISFSIKTGYIINLKSKVLTSFLVIILSIIFTLIINNKGDIKILAIQEKNAWATDIINYDDKDWTLKSAYSYSLLYELIENIYNIKKTNSLISTNLDEFNVLFFMTPTKLFSKEEKFILDNYIKKGGKIIFIADHTDLYGHARAINSFTKDYGITIRYDAVFKPHNKHAKAILENFIFPKVRIMTSSSISLGIDSSVLAFCHNFILENADYTRPNFFAEMIYTPDDKYGTFPLVIEKNIGKGNIVICSESTIFSNFSIFHPNVLKLLDLLFLNTSFTSTISKYSLILFIISGLFIFFANINLNILIPTSFIIITLISRCFYFCFDDSINFYNKENIFIIKSDDKYIYDPYFENIDSSNTSCSYLFSAIHRYGLYPYYINNFFINKKINLIVGNYKYITNLEKNQKLLSITKYNGNNKNIISINDSLSDYKLGNWWTQIDVSPYRKNRVKCFVDWVKHNKEFLNYKYPSTNIIGKNIYVNLKNDIGENKIIKINLNSLYNINDGDCLLIDNNVWALKSIVDNDIILIGGDSFNDKRNIEFFSRYWFGIIKKN